eukprot:gene9099-10043_t
MRDPGSQQSLASVFRKQPRLSYEHLSPQIQSPRHSSSSSSAAGDGGEYDSSKPMKSSTKKSVSFAALDRYDTNNSNISSSSSNCNCNSNHMMILTSSIKPNNHQEVKTLEEKEKEEKEEKIIMTSPKSKPIHLKVFKIEGSKERRISETLITVTKKTCYWSPSYTPPKRYQLSPLSDSVIAQPIVRKWKAHFSSKRDAEEEEQRLHSLSRPSSSSSSYLKNAMSIKYLYDVPSFNGGRKQEEEEVEENVQLDHGSSSIRYEDSIQGVIRSTIISINRRRCLLPTFTPPRRKDVLVLSNTTKSSKVLLPTTTDGSHYHHQSIPSSWLKSQIQSPTQTPSPPTTSSANSLMANIGKGGLTAGNSDTMSRLMVLSMELFCRTRQDLLANPKYDSIDCIIWVVDDMLRSASMEHLHRFAENEIDLISKFLSIVQDLDPDFLVGYENTTHSYGYLIKRGNILNINCIQLLSRLPKEKPSYRNSIVIPSSSSSSSAAAAEEEEGEGHFGGNSNKSSNNQQHNNNDDDDNSGDSSLDAGDVGIYLKGRIFLNNWQIISSEVKLSDCSIQHTVEVILNQRIPYFSSKQLTYWCHHHNNNLHIMISYLYTLTLVNLLLLEKLDIFRKISECARLYGIDFHSVIHRGSQYRVEATLLHKAHHEGYLLLSASREQVARQAPMEVIPLVLEPKCAFYTDPIIVLDFQSLYPSIMIAFNLCFSTIMGKLRPADTTGKLGVIHYPEGISAALAARHHTMISASSISDNSDRQQSMSTEEGTPYTFTFDDTLPYIAPNGSIFTSREIRKGILPSMLEEMLESRVMIKNAMKRYSKDGNNNSSDKYKVLLKVLDARQLAIKLLSNVTYGYTAAGFSGRMPMAELADAIVQTGRTLLQYTIHTINHHPRWHGEVVYGDTDSVFVHLPGRTLQEAFIIGEEIAQTITLQTPKHIILKFEKVYWPSILITKKRYVGRCYENKNNLNNNGHLDAKGIEMIRKDQCQITKKIQEKILRLLFQSKDLTQIKQYLTIQWLKLLQDNGRIVLKDFIFYKEVRYGYYHTISSQPPGAIVATKSVLIDEMTIPPYNWRVPYLVVYGPPNTPLKHLVYHPNDVLKRGSSLRCNFLYYIMKCINPALDRILSIVGVNINQWFRCLPRPKANPCQMTYSSKAKSMVEIVNQVGKNDYPQYKLWKINNYSTKKLNPYPVLFIPGHYGSDSQGRSLAAEVHNQDGLLQFFAVDFNNEAVAFHGSDILTKAAYVNYAIHTIQSLYEKNSKKMSQEFHLTLIGHSYGGFIAKSALILSNYPKCVVNTIIMLSTPISKPPLSLDGSSDWIMRHVNKAWFQAHYNRSILHTSVMDMNDSLEEDSLSWGEGEGHSIIKADFHSPICVKDVRIISITGGNVDGHVSPRITDVFDITPRPRNHSMTQPISKVYTLQKFYEVRSLLKDMGSTMIKKVKSLLFWKTSKETLTEEVPANDDVKKMNRNVTGKFAFITQQNWEKDILPYHEPLHITLRTSQLNEVGFPVDHFAVVWCYDLLSTVHDGLRVLVRKPKASMAAILDGFSVVNRSDILASIDQTGARGIPQLEAFSIREAIHEAFQSTSANDDGEFMLSKLYHNYLWYLAVQYINEHLDKIVISYIALAILSLAGYMLRKLCDANQATTTTTDNNKSILTTGLSIHFTFLWFIVSQLFDYLGIAIINVEVLMVVLAWAIFAMAILQARVLEPSSAVLIVYWSISILLSYGLLWIVVSVLYLVGYLIDKISTIVCLKQLIVRTLTKLPRRMTPRKTPKMLKSIIQFISDYWCEVMMVLIALTIFLIKRDLLQHVPMSTYLLSVFTVTLYMGLLVISIVFLLRHYSLLLRQGGGGGGEKSVLLLCLPVVLGLAWPSFDFAWHFLSMKNSHLHHLSTAFAILSGERLQYCVMVGLIVFHFCRRNATGSDGKEVKEVETLVRWTRPLFHQQLKGSAQCLHEDGGKCSIYQRVYTEEDNGKKSYYIGPSYKVIWCDCRGEDKSLKHVEDWCEWCRCEKCSGQPLPSRFTHYDGSHNLKPPGSLTINVDLALLLLLYVIVGGTFYYGSDRLHLILYSIGAWSFIAVMRDRYEHEVTIGV